MDMFYIAGYSLALIIIPFVIYFLVSKNSKESSVDSKTDWFYYIKLYYARDAVKIYQRKYNEECNSVSKYWEVVKPPATYKHSTWQFIHGVDQKGNSVSIKFTLRFNKIAEILLTLRIKGGDFYAFPENYRIKRVALPKGQWKTNGFNIEILEPFKRFRLTFNGLLQNLSSGKLEHVQFSLIFNAAGSPTFIPHGMDRNLLSQGLVRENWRDGSWMDYLFHVDQCGYEQFGALQGFVKGDSFPELYVLNLACCQSKYRGLGDEFLLRRMLRIFMADDYGNLINIVAKSFKKGCSQLNYGSAILSNGKVVPLTALDILLCNIGEHALIPDMITVHVQVKKKSFKCVLHLNNSQVVRAVNSEENGYAYYNISAECDINLNQGRAIVEFWYSQRGTTKFEPNILITPKSVRILPADLILNIKCDDAKIVELTGGKGSSLALLSSINSHLFAVPDGFIITVNAFRSQLKWKSHLAKAVQAINDVCCGRNSGELEVVCRKTVACFKKEKIIPDIVNIVLKEIDKIGRHSDGWAVRSSAVGEDSEELSAAGQNETFLGCVTNKQILKSISSCWASLFSYQSVQYRWQHGLPIIADMAVVVQRMIPADSAGVLFTWHPSTSNPSQMVITSNYGLGESVVSGKADPDTFILNRTFDGKVRLAEHNIGMKNKVMKMTARGVEEVDIEKNRLRSHQNWSITSQQALHLGKVGVLLEEMFGGPKDIEWAFHKDQLYLLQSRPITTLNVWSEFELTHELDTPVLSDQTIFTMANISEVIPNALTVLSQTSTIPILDRGMQLRLTNQYQPYAPKLVSCQHTGMIDDLQIIHVNIMKKVTASSTIMDLAIFGHKVFDEHMNDIAIKKMGITPAIDILKQFLQMTYSAWIIDKVFRRMQKAVASLRLDVIPDEPLLVTYKKIENLTGELYHIARDHCCTSSVSVFYQVLTMNLLLEGELTREHCADFAKIVSSCKDVVSAEIPAYLEKMAKIIRDEGYTEEFCTIKPEFGAAWLEAKCPESYRIFQEFLEKHGHRNLGEFEVMERTWSENTSKVISMIQANVKNNSTSEKTHKNKDEIIKSLIIPRYLHTKIFIKLIMKKIQSAVGYRELSKSELIRALFLLKTAYRQLAKQMVSRGVLPSPDLIYHLTHYEIGQVIQGNNPLLITKAIQRQRLYPKWLKIRFPEIMFGVPAPEEKGEPNFPTSFSDRVCQGTPVCAGTIMARACVINSLDNIDQLQTGDILITYSTDIGWSPYFPMLSGIVTEMGGLISHGAVVAREYGLPCIVGVKNATKVFNTGDMVILFGDTGELRLTR